MPVIPAGSFNPNATIAPGVVVIESLAPGSISGIPTNQIGLVGTSTWGPIDSPVNCTNASDYANSFGSVQTTTFDMGTALNAACLQGLVANYVCIRVTDGTDEMASTDLLDAAASQIIGAILTAKYSGVTGNTLTATITAGSAAASYNLNIGRPGYAAETFVNISGSGAAFWIALVNAVNNGQSGVRGPSNLVVASLGTGVGSIAVTLAGTAYTTIPTISFTGGGGGTGAVATALMKALTATISAPGTGYIPAQTITFTGGTGTQAVATIATTQVVSATIAAGGSSGTPGPQIVTGTTGAGTKFQANVTVSVGGAITAVNSIALGGSYSVNPTVLTAEPVTGADLVGAQLSLVMGVATATITTVGSYSVLPSSPVAQGSSSGSGTGATFVLSYGVLAVVMSAHGSNYTVPPTVVFSTGSATATATIGSSSAPSTSEGNYVFTGGTNGNGDVDATTELGADGAQPSGMYALQNTNVSLFALVDNDDTTTFSDQDAFAQQIGAQAILVGEPGQTVAQAISAKNTAAISDNSSIFLVGDWCYFIDTNNSGITRLISPQGFYGGLMGNLSPEQSPLNKTMYGIVATQKTSMNQVYSSQDKVNMMQNGLEVISNPINRGPVFGCLTGKSGGLDQSLNNACVLRMANFLAFSFSESGVLGTFIGDLQTPSVRAQARTALVAFLKNLEASQQIQNSEVFLDNGNNPLDRVVLGFMQASINVQLYSVIIVFLIDLNVGTTQIQSATQVTP